LVDLWWVVLLLVLTVLCDNNSDPEVKTFALFIGSLGNQAVALARDLPPGFGGCWKDGRLFH
jgi:hypothetical protein